MTPMPAAVILAAGKGTRLKSELPKALHTVCGVPMLDLLIERSEALGCRDIFVVAGHRADLVRKAVGPRAAIVLQKARLGSGHAVGRTAGRLRNFKGPLFVFYCDTPLLTAATVERLRKSHRASGADGTLLSTRSKNPRGYGRVVRGPGGRVLKIVEEINASEEEKRLDEVNVGCYVFESKKLFPALSAVRRDPLKKEIYLTDVIELLARRGRVEAVVTGDREEVLGVNSRRELATVEEAMQRRILEAWMDKGVRIRDPRTTVIDANVRIGQDTVILPHTVIEEGSVIGKGCTIGPFARIRGKSRIGDGSVIGNFVEIVRSTLGRKTLVKHLSYLGDARVGSYVNIGAGTITANFDGMKKYNTIIKDKAQIGSGTIFVAPVTVGRSARTGAGAVVTKGNNIPDRGVFVGVPARQIRKRTKR